MRFLRGQRKSEKERGRERAREREMDELLLLVHSVQRT